MVFLVLIYFKSVQPVFIYLYLYKVKQIYLEMKQGQILVRHSTVRSSCRYIATCVRCKILQVLWSRYRTQPTVFVLTFQCLNKTNKQTKNKNSCFGFLHEQKCQTNRQTNRRCETITGRHAELAPLCCCFLSFENH